MRTHAKKRDDYKHYPQRKSARYIELFPECFQFQDASDVYHHDPKDDPEQKKVPYNRFEWVKSAFVTDPSNCCCRDPSDLLHWHDKDTPDCEVDKYVTEHRLNTMDWTTFPKLIHRTTTIPKKRCEKSYIFNTNNQDYRWLFFHIKANEQRKLVFQELGLDD